MFDAIVKVVLATGAGRGVKYLSPKEVIRVTRVRYRGGFDPHVLEFRVMRGRPNYAEREFVKQAKKAGEPFPIKKVQLTFRRNAE